VEREPCTTPALSSFAAANSKVINFPGLYFYGYATGINSFGKVVGYTDDGSERHGYAYDRGQFKAIDFPGGNWTLALGINDSGVIVGWYSVGNTDYGFVLINGKYTSFRYPGAQATAAQGINTAGQIVGSYTSDFTHYHGFVTSPITGG
jgi:probable HAF family extracellular repeat protein